jgi:hypothetical protein
MTRFSEDRYGAIAFLQIPRPDSQRIEHELPPFLLVLPWWLRGIGRNLLLGVAFSAPCVKKPDLLPGFSFCRQWR